jgi:hypothetical protein
MKIAAGHAVIRRAGSTPRQFKKQAIVADIAKMIGDFRSSPTT